MNLYCTYVDLRANEIFFWSFIAEKFCKNLINNIRSSKKKHKFLIRISIKKESRRADFLLFIISYCMLSLHIITFPQGYIGTLRSNINKTKHQILIKHKFV